jgi:hypothetical protein
MVPLLAFESETAATAPVDPTSLDFGPPEDVTDVFGGATVRNWKRCAEKKATARQDIRLGKEQSDGPEVALTTRRPAAEHL